MAFRCGVEKSATKGHGTWHRTLPRRRWRSRPLFGAKVGIACGHAGAKRRRCCPFGRVLERAGVDEEAGLKIMARKFTGETANGTGQFLTGVGAQSHYSALR